MAWKNPDSTNNPTEWENEANAIDGSTSTFAKSWAIAQYLELNLASPIVCDKVRLYAALWDAYYETFSNTGITIDLYYDGAWHTIFSGNITKQVFVEKTIPDGAKVVSKARVIFNLIDAGLWGYLYVFQFNDTPVRRTVITSSD
jgi:hypothetical protein